MFDDLNAGGPPQRKAGPAMFGDLAPPPPTPTAPPALLRRPVPRPSKLQRAAVNAEAAFFGADGDTAGLASEAIVDQKSGALQARAARADLGFADLLGGVGLDALAGHIRSTAQRHQAEARVRAAAFAREQARRRQAVVALGPAQTFGEKAADFGGRVTASLPQPENFVGGPTIKGLSLTGKVIRAGTAAAVANAATEPVLQGSAVARGTRDKLSGRDAVENTAVAFGTGGAFGGIAHGAERLRARTASPTGAPAAGMFNDLRSPPAGAPEVDDFSIGAAPDRQQIGQAAPPPEPVFRPNSPPPVGGDGSLFGDLRDLTAGNTVEQSLGDLVGPDDVTPLSGPRLSSPDNRVSSLAESEIANPSTFAEPDGAQRITPVGPADLDARALPPEAYRSDLPAARELAGNIRTDLLDSPQSIDRALREVAFKAGGFEEARRGIQRQDQTLALAADMGMTADDLLKRRKGQALNAEQALAARQLLAKSGNELVGLAQRARGGSDEDLAAFRTSLLRHAAIQEQVSGATAEAGRALAQFRMTADSRAVHGPVIRGDLIRSIIDGAGGREHLEDVAGKLLEEGTDPGKINKLALMAAKPGGREKFLELYINSLLSGPQTHAVNILSNAITAIGQIPETVGAAAFGAFRRGDPDRVLFSEAGARAVGLIQGASEGLRLARTAFRTGEPTDFVGAIENSHHRAISGRKGELIRVPTRALTAEDEFFKAIARRMEINAVAVRKAAGEGLKGKARRERVAELAANPTDDMHERAREYARYQTFQRKLGPMGQRMLAVTNAPTGGGTVAKWLFPFLRTPINLVKYAAERSPLAPLMREWREDITAGGARRDTALARLTFGSGVASLIATWAADGTVTGGGPADPEQRALMMAEGWRPYSIRLGDCFYSYERLDPLATTLGTVADIVERAGGDDDADAGEAGAAAVASIANNLGGGIFLDTMSDLADAVSDPGNRAQKFLASQAGKLVPAAVGQIAQTIDPVIREAKAPLDRIKSRVPGLSQGLLPKRDIWGEPIRRPARLGPDLASPLPVGQALNDPTNRELLRLGVQIGRVQRRIGDFELTAVEYDAYQDIAGKLARQYIRGEMADNWHAVPDAEKPKLIADAVKDARADARDLMRQRFPHLQPAE